MQNRDASFEIEPLFARITRIEKENPIHRFAKWFVSMAENNDIRIFTHDAAVNRVRWGVRVHDVMEKKFFLTKLNDFCFREAQSCVRVAQNGGHWGDLFQVQNYPGHPNVATVQDVIHASKYLGDLRIEIIVRV